jgi:hypothetical protein
VKGNVSATVSFVLVAIVLAASGPAHARPLSIDAIPAGAGELTALTDLAATLKDELQAVEQLLVAECDAVETRDRLLEVRNRALRAVNRLGSLWQTGRLRSGALAASEGLTRDLVVLIYEAQDAAVLAHALAGMQDEARRTPGGRLSAQRGVDIRQPACVVQPFAASSRADRPITGSRLDLDLNITEGAGENR